MKKIFKTLMPLFGASFSFTDPSVPKFTEKVSIPKELFIHTKVEKNFDFETTLENNQSQFLEKKTALNKTKVFLIVNTQRGNKKKSEKNILLLVGIKDQANTYSSVKKYREKSYSNYMYHTWNKDGKKYIKKKVKVIFEPWEKDDNSVSAGIERLLYMYYNKFNVTIAFKNAFAGENFRGASYLTRQKGSYQSICPVFFEEDSAKNFLMENLQYLEDMLIQNKPKKILDGTEKISKEFSIKLKNKKTMPQEFKSIDNIRIVSLGLGDFIEYYSTASDQKLLEKVDFLFFPNLEKQGKTKNKTIRMKGFRAYQQQLYKYKTL